MNKKILFLIALILPLLFTGCGLLKKGTDVNSNPNFIQVGGGLQVSNDVEEKANSDTSAADSLKNIEPPSVSKYYKELQGEWTIVSVFNKKIDMEEMPFLNFDTETGKLYGNNGCNVVNADIVIDKNTKSIHFDYLITSMMACPNMKTETMINSAMGKTSSYSFSNSGGVSFLNLRDSRNNVVLTLKRHNLDILNGAWTVKEINGEKINDKINNNQIELVIDIQESKIHGNTSCNIVNGNIVFDPKKNDAVQFAQLLSTRMACPDMATETALLVALEEVEFFKKKSSSEIELLDNKKNVLIVLKRLPLMK